MLIDKRIQKGLVKFFLFFQNSTELMFSKFYLVGRKISEVEVKDIKNRLKFYSGKSSPKLILRSKLKLKDLFNSNPILLFDDPQVIPEWVPKERIFDIDFRRNPVDGWVWIKLAQIQSVRDKETHDVQDRFTRYVRDLKVKNYNKTYIFGTGPSLEKAIDRDWSDGYRIVCNTIVRDSVLWNHLKPHFIVAGDAIYHFGHTAFAKAFRKDLYKRLKETETFFMYPKSFHEIVMRELDEFSDRLIPIPGSKNSQKIHVDLTNNFELPSLGNVLSLLLLPLGCTLSKNVYLWGFDGRGSTDKLFWNNSTEHSYSDLLPELKNAHPAFFEYFPFFSLV